MKLFLLFLIYILSIYSYSFSISRSEIINLVKNNILLKNGIDSVEVKIYSPEKKIKKLRGKRIIMTTKLSHGFKSYQRFKLIGENFSCTLTFNIKFYKKIPISRDDLKKGDIISISNIEYKMIDISSMTNFIDNDKFIIGKMTKRNFNKGNFFQKASLKLVPLVIKDGNVKVIVKNSLINLSFETKAFSSGYKGEKIYFMNPFNSKLQLGTVIGVGTVQL